MTWNDVSSAYAGVFFRVAGGEAASFGQVQGDNAPRLIGVYSRYCEKLRDNPTSESHLLMKLGRRSGVTAGEPLFDIDFEMSDGEVRPRNMAIRVWKRA
jgi:hypothetical protein